MPLCVLDLLRGAPGRAAATYLGTRSTLWSCMTASQHLPPWSPSAASDGTDATSGRAASPQTRDSRARSRVSRGVVAHASAWPLPSVVDSTYDDGTYDSNDWSTELG
jgi:hypothetical protein